MAFILLGSKWKNFPTTHCGQDKPWQTQLHDMWHGAKEHFKTHLIGILQ